MTDTSVHAGPGTRERYEEVRRRVAEAARRSGRRPEDVLIVAVTKHASPEQVRELLALGQVDFGESRVQHLARRVATVDEFLQRHRTLTPSREVVLPGRVRWHLVGHLQRNKSAKAIELATLIHSVDTLRLAEELQERAEGRESPVEVLLQVNASFERQKFGVALPAARHLAEQIDSMIALRLRGLMTMAPLTEDHEVVRECFERCAEVFAEIQFAGIGGGSFDILSMGMTNDFETAIECGANMVRIGTAIFGERSDAAESDEPDEER